MVTQQPSALVMADRPDRILIVGCGAIGGIVAAGLLENSSRKNTEIQILSRNLTFAKSINQNGLHVIRSGETRVVPARVYTTVELLQGPYDWILLATQPPQVEHAVLEVRDQLKDDGYIVCFQNGLCEQRLETILGHNRIIGAIIAWGASTTEPGHYHQTSSGSFVLGSLSAEHSSALRSLSPLLEDVAPINLTDNLVGARWSKLAINCAISTLGTIGGDRLGVLLRYAFVRRLALEIMTELVQVTQADDISLTPIAGTFNLDWLALTKRERNQWSPDLLAKHVVLIAVGLKYRRLRSSMLRAIEAGKEPAVEFLNGEVARAGKRLGVPTPVNDLAISWVHDIAAGIRVSSVSTLHELYEASRH